MKTFKTSEEIVWRWISGWLHHYGVKVPRARPPKEMIEAIEKEKEKRKKK